MENLKHMNTTIMPIERCKQGSAQLSMFVHTGYSFCTKDSFGGGVHKGDIGSPAVDLITNELIGIASWFTSTNGGYDVFTAVSPYIDWIEAKIEFVGIFVDFEL